MKQPIKLCLSAVMVLVLFSCKEEARNTEPLTDPWLKERTPKIIRVESQVGKAVITHNWRNDNEGAISVMLIATNVDLSAVRITQLELPEGASATIAEGDTLDFEGDETPQFTVTSENGLTRTYTVQYEAFNEPLEGTYKMNVLSGILGGGNPSSIAVIGSFPGNVTVSTVGDKGWNFPTSGNKDNDNIITFKLIDVDDETGVTSGTCVHHYGPDATYQEYTWNSRPEWGDRNGYYRNVPIKQTRWEKRVEKVGDNDVTRVYFFDYETGEELKDVNDGPQYADILGAGTYTYPEDEGKSMTVAYQAFHRQWPGPYTSVLNEWSDYRWLFWNIRHTFVLVEKTSEVAHPDHESWLEMNFE